MRQAAAFLDPRELERLGDLQLVARAVVAGVGGGVHRGLGSGQAVEFAQYRPYSPGDAAGLVDWRLYGRSDRLYLKEFHQDNNLRLTLLLDCSASMAYASPGHSSKFAYGRLLAAAIAALAQNQRDAVGLLAYRAAVELFVPPRAGGAHLRGLLARLQGLEAVGGTETGVALSEAVEALPPRGMVVLLSDLLCPLEEALEHLRALKARGHDVLVLRLSDPAERDFSFADGTALEDAEGGQRCYVTGPEQRRLYLENRARHFGRLRQACLADGIETEEFTTDSALGEALQRFLQRRFRLAGRAGASAGRAG